MAIGFDLLGQPENSHDWFRKLIEGTAHASASRQVILDAEHATTIPNRKNSAFQETIRRRRKYKIRSNGSKMP